MSTLRIAAAALTALLALASVAAAAEVPSGTKTITLVAADGTRQVLGKVDFTPDGDGAKFAVLMDAPELHEQFLSMRPFRCLSGAKQQWCHLSYDYGLRRRVTATDLVDLEYSLMFIWRTYDRVSADAWNGLYFKLAQQPDGSLAGPLFEADLNVLATPPDQEFARPIAHTDLTRAEPGRRLFERIEIR
jgi:hypothetical protein